MGITETYDKIAASMPPSVGAYDKWTLNQVQGDGWGDGRGRREWGIKAAAIFGAVGGVCGT